MTQPLAGIRVVEFGAGIACSYAGKLLADYGADVVKVEPPDGERNRHVGPFPPSGPDPEQSALFLHLNTNKRSVVSGTGAAATPTLDDDLVGGLIDRADIVLQAGPLPAPELLRDRNSRLVVVTVTAFGLTGPLAGTAGEEIVHYAYGGPMSASGDPTREPLKMGGDIGQYQCGAVGAVAALASLTVAERSGIGVHVDLANVETQIGSIDRRMTYLLFGSYRNENVARPGGYRLSSLPNGIRPTLDGHVQISTQMNWLPRMLGVVDNPDLAAIYDDPGFLLDEAVPELVDAHLLGWTLTKTKQDAMEEAQAAGWPITAINRPIDLLSDHHFAARDFFRTVEHPVAGPVRQAGPPFRIDGGWALRRPAPLLGQHDQEVRAELAETAAPDRAIPADPERRELPLAGVRVLDMTVVWAGPYATCILGDLGAEIIRVDNPWIFPTATRGGMARPPQQLIDDGGGIFAGYPDAEAGERPWNRIALFNAHARNKKSITLDLRQDSGREAFLRLVDVCDLLIENNSVDLMDRLGLGWDEIHARNPRMIMIRMPSVGSNGPYRGFLGFGVNFEGLCGLTALRGYLDADLSESETVFHMDAASGSAGAFAALTALRRRDATGVGELVELSQSENMMNHIGELFIDADRTGAEHAPMGNRHRIRAPQGCYPCQGDDAWVVLSVGSDDEWSALGRAAGDPDWARDPRFADLEGRRANHDEIDRLVAAWTSALTPREVFDACRSEGVPAAPVLHELEAMADEHLNARGMFRPNGSADTGTHLHPTHLWRWDGPDLRWDRLPVLGGDNREVLMDIAGLTADEYQDLDDGGHLSLDYLDAEGNPL